MRLDWSEAAVSDLEHIADYLFVRTPLHAPRLVRTIHDAPAKLLADPLLGRHGRRAGTRELVLTPLPYLIIYVVSSEAVHIVRILHGAQRWP